MLYFLTSIHFLPAGQNGSIVTMRERSNGKGVKGAVAFSLMRHCRFSQTNTITQKPIRLKSVAPYIKRTLELFHQVYIRYFVTFLKKEHIAIARLAPIDWAKKTLNLQDCHLTVKELVRW